MSQSSSRAHSHFSPKDTPKSSSSRAKRSNPTTVTPSTHKTLEQFYSGVGAVKDLNSRGGVNSLFSPVLSNMHKGSGVLVKATRANDSAG
mmetsp:Transcript_10893/g.14673  ORF Transcript_10893/g.14673 Transcript_10893/m.14673 type:complete len:90 (-) Transcript_10893:453-722(-)